MVLNELNKFIQSNPDPRELKRALAVQMILKGYKHRQIQSILGISSGFISKWTDKYRQSGVKGFKLGYIGSVDNPFKVSKKSGNRVFENGEDRGKIKSSSVRGRCS